MFNRKIMALGFVAGGLLLFSCNKSTKTKTEKMEQTTTEKKEIVTDVHSYSNPQEISITHLNLDIEVLFEQKIIRGKATLDLERKTEADKLVLDSRDLKIKKVFAEPGKEELKFDLGKAEEVFGQPLTIWLTEGTKK